MFHFFVMLGTAFVVIEALMLFFWFLYGISRNINLIDIGWGLGFIAAALIYFIMGEGYLWRKILILTIVSIWAIRLVWHFAHRFTREQDNPRYQLLMNKWPFSPYPLLQVLTLFVFQGFLILILSLPFALMSQATAPFFTTLEVFGLLIWMCGVIGETVADDQLDRFKKNTSNIDKVYDGGLWKYSRHPNYFFEWIVWVGYFLMALSSPFGWIAIISPILIFFLLLKGSGIPLIEAHARETKGEAYRNYQERTSQFFPWFSYNNILEQTEEKSEKSKDIDETTEKNKPQK